MRTLLLLYVVTAKQSLPPKVPSFFTMYRDEVTCVENVRNYMALNGKTNLLFNAICVDPRNPNLVTLLKDVPELTEISPYLHH